MLENPLLSVAFVVAATSFFKTQFSLAGRAALLCAFGVSLLVGLAPVLEAALPVLAPWITQVVGVVALFIGAAGSYDAFVEFKAK
jgi:protein-S-isoprenylcysteine O-methyltransferase Ste14